MNLSCYKLFTLISVFSAQIAASELPSSQRVFSSQTHRCAAFIKDVINKRSFFGAYTGEEDSAALSRIRGAECLCVAGACTCALAGYGVVACAADPASAYALGAVSGCGGGVAFTMCSNNNPRCGLYQSESSLTRKQREDEIIAIVARKYPHLAQQQMQIAPSPIETSINPMQ